MKLKSVAVNSLFMRAAVIWLGLCAFAFVNGALRELIIKNLFAVNDPFANQISCVSGVLFWSAFTIWRWPYLQIKSWSQAFSVGFGWLLTTFLFETFIIGRNLNWSQIIVTYDLSTGQYWGLVLLWIGFMPILFYAILSIWTPRS